MNLKKSHTVLHIGCASLYYQQRIRVTFPRHSCWHVLSFYFLHGVVLRWGKISLWFCLHFPNGEWSWTFFMCLLAIYISSLENYLFISVVHFLTGLFILLLNHYRIHNQLHNWKIFSLFCWLSLHFDDLISSTETYRAIVLTMYF